MWTSTDHAITVLVDGFDEHIPNPQFLRRGEEKTITCEYDNEQWPCKSVKQEAARLVKMSEETVTISKAEYESLLEDSRFLSRLEGAGVDNWEGYSMAFDDDED